MKIIRKRFKNTKGDWIRSITFPFCSSGNELVLKLTKNDKYALSIMDDGVINKSHMVRNPEDKNIIPKHMANKISELQAIVNKLGFLLDLKCARVVNEEHYREGKTCRGELMYRALVKNNKQYDYRLICEKCKSSWRVKENL